MNKLSIQNPSFQFILHEYQTRFTKNILLTYEKSVNVKTNKDRIPIPNIPEDLFLYTFLDHPEEFAASYLAHKHQQREQFFEQTAQLTQKEKEAFIRHIVKSFHMTDEPQYLHLWDHDIQTVLNTHQMSFGYPKQWGFFWEEGLDIMYKNMPIIQVW